MVTKLMLNSLMIVASILLFAFPVASMMIVRPEDAENQTADTLTSAATVKQIQLETASKAGLFVSLLMVVFLLIVLYKHLPKPPKKRQRETFVRIKVRE